MRKLALAYRACCRIGWWSCSVLVPLTSVIGSRSTVKCAEAAIALSLSAPLLRGISDVQLNLFVGQNCFLFSKEVHVPTPGAASHLACSATKHLQISARLPELSGVVSHVSWICSPQTPGHGVRTITGATVPVHAYPQPLTQATLCPL
jgi:hypothetical protein